MQTADSILQDVRIAGRMLAKNRGATLLSIVSIALGIGLTSSMFSVGDAMMLRPFPFRDPGGVLRATSYGDDGRYFGYGWLDYTDMARAAGDSAELTALTRRGGMLTIGDELIDPIVHAVTPNYFSFLGAKAVLGRASIEEVEGRPTAVMGHRMWSQRFGADPQILGKTVILNGKAFLVAGVMPAEFLGTQRGVATDLWISTDAWFDVLGNRGEKQSRSGVFEVIARLNRGATKEQLASVLDAAVRGPDKHKPAPASARGTVLDAEFAPGWQTSLVYGGGLLLCLGLVLFVACANVTQVRLAQAEARKRELGVRIALGAGGWRLTRQLVIESALMSVVGVSLGLVLARWAMDLVAEFITAGRTWVDPGFRMDLRVLAFAVTAAILSVLVTGLMPARHAVKVDVNSVLKAEQRTCRAGGDWRKNLLIIGQLSVSVALFGAAILFVQSLRNATAVRPALDPTKNLYIMRVVPSWSSEHLLWYESACARLASLPEIRGATFARRMPLSGSEGGAEVRVEIPGQAARGVYYNYIAGNYFSLMGTRILAGRGIDTNDRKGSTPVLAVSQHFARTLYKGRNPIGEWVTVDGVKRQIIGIIENGPSNHVHEKPEPYVYLPVAQRQMWEINPLIVETAGDPALSIEAIRSELKRFDSGVKVLESTTLRQHMLEALSTDRMMADLSGAVGVCGMTLTLAGLFGIVQYMVNQRTRELGLRMALGARTSQIQTGVLTEALRLCLWGIPLGLVLLAVLARMFRSSLMGVTPLDPMAYLIAAGTTLLVALAAAWLPAQRATRIDPIAALRNE